MSKIMDYKDKNIGYVYLLTNNVNGKRYVGISYQPFFRWTEHQGSSTRIGRAIAYYGYENFTKEILAVSSRKGALELEAHFCLVYNTLHPYGYNMVAGGRGQIVIAEGRYYSLSDEARTKIREARARQEVFGMVGKKHTEETKLLISEKKSGPNNPMYGTKWTDERRKVMIDKLTGRKHTSESRAKMKGRPGTRNGKTNSNEHRTKIKEAWDRRKADPIAYEAHCNKIRESKARKKEQGVRP